MASSNTAAKSETVVSKPSSSRPTTLSLDIPSPYQTQQAEKSTRPPSPRRIFSDPLPPTSSSATTSTSATQQYSSSIISAGGQEHPHSASAASPRNVRFGNFGRFGSFGRGETPLVKSMTTPVPRKGSMSHRGDFTKRRHSSEARMNVHTECGRHSDDWLFGGFSVSGAVKKLGKKKDSKEKEVIEELEENG